MVKLLIIDDDVTICDFLKSFFSKIGYDVSIANEGKQAVDIVREKRPEIILLDVKMPGFSGLEVLQEIKKIDNTSKVIMVSAVDEGIVIELAERYGATGYIIKPFSLERLEREVFRASPHKETYRKQIH